MTLTPHQGRQMPAQAAQGAPAPGQGGMTRDHAVAASGILGMLAECRDYLRRLAGSAESEPDQDLVYLLSVAPAVNTAYQIQIPRNPKHVELTMNITATGTTSRQAILFNGTLDTGTASTSLNPGGQSSGIMCVATNGSSSFTCREFLDGSGMLTILIVSGGVAQVYVTLRVRVLDRVQSRARRS